MLDTLRTYTDITPLLLFLSFLLVVGSVGLWYVKKTTGRSMKDMLAVLAAGLILTVLMTSAGLIFREQVKSRTATRES